MDKKLIIAHARKYMEQLSNGIDPISGTPVPADSTLQQTRLKKCFAFVEEILGEIIENNGVVQLTETDPTTASVSQQSPESASMQSSEFTVQQIQSVQITSSLILPSAFVKRINSVVDQRTQKKITLTKINKWLLKQGYLSERTVPTLVNKSVKEPTEQAAQVGLIEQLVADRKTGEAKPQLFFSPAAQEFILSNINEIAKL